MHCLPSGSNGRQVSRERPLERCNECGNVVKLDYVGPTEDPHARTFLGLFVS